MKRRNFLLGATALTLPAWLGCAFGSKSEWAFDDEDIQKGSTIGKAFLRAQALGKPLLVLVIPPYPFSSEQMNDKSDAEKEKYWAVSTGRYERGHAFGEFLNNASEEQRWTLALCEVICALPEEIEYVTGPLTFSYAPLMVLIETDTKSPTAISVDGVLPKLFGDQTYFADYEEEKKNEEKLINDRIILIAKLLKDALAPTPKTLERRANQVRSSLTGYQDLEKKISTKALTSKESDAIAGIVAETATKTKSKELFALLAQATNERLCKPPIEGSRWAHSGGCGITYETPIPKPPKIITHPNGMTEIEIETVTITSCGMGHTPEKSQRFLDFYTEESV
jgi:hypothetical protein